MKKHWNSKRFSPTQNGNVDCCALSTQSVRVVFMILEQNSPAAKQCCICWVCCPSCNTASDEKRTEMVYQKRSLILQVVFGNSTVQTSGLNCSQNFLTEHTRPLNIISGKNHGFRFQIFAFPQCFFFLCAQEHFVSHAWTEDFGNLIQGLTRFAVRSPWILVVSPRLVSWSP